MSRSFDEAMMQRALELARVPPFTSPNPRVGAVVVRAGDVIAEGYHAGAGTPHAETEVLSRTDATGADLYVTLEPCTHAGRTPPCVPQLVAAGIRRVVIPFEDPDVRVRGRGIEALRAAGLQVTTGVLEAEARALNAAYLHQRTTGRPLVTLKLAQSLDGKIAAPDRTSRWITGPAARAAVHARRLEADAVVVGSGTILADDPRLTARATGGPPPARPVRVVLDSRGRTSPRARLFADAASTPVVIATTAAAPHERHTEWKEAGAEVVVLPAAEGTSRLDLHALIEDFARRGWLEVYVEGGAEVATALLRAGLVDRLELHFGPKLIGGDGVGLGPLGVATIADASTWHLVSVAGADDVVAVYERGDR